MSISSVPLSAFFSRTSSNLQRYHQALIKGFLQTTLPGLKKNTRSGILSCILAVIFLAIKKTFEKNLQERLQENQEMFVNELQEQFKKILVGFSAGMTEVISEGILEATHGRFFEAISV